MQAVLKELTDLPNAQPPQPVLLPGMAPPPPPPPPPSCCILFIDDIHNVTGPNAQQVRRAHVQHVLRLRRVLLYVSPKGGGVNDCMLHAAAVV